MLPLPVCFPQHWELNNGENSLFLLTQPSICRFYAPHWLGVEDNWLLVPRARAPVVGADNIPELCSQNTNSAKPCRAVTTLCWATSLTHILIPSPTPSLHCSQIPDGSVPCLTSRRRSWEHLCHQGCCHPFLTHPQAVRSPPGLPSCSWDLLPRAHTAGMSLYFFFCHPTLLGRMSHCKCQAAALLASSSLKSPSRKPEGGGNSIWPQELQAFLFYVLATVGNARLGVHRLSREAGGCWLQSGNEAISTLALGLCSG